MVRERNGIIRLSLAYVEETDIGTYGIRVWNEHGEAYCEAKLMYDGLEVEPEQALGDCYLGFDKYQISGLPVALPGTKDRWISSPEDLSVNPVVLSRQADRHPDVRHEGDPHVEACAAAGT